MLDPVFRRQGFARHEIITRWTTIVGPSLGEHSQPERINFPRGDRSGGTVFVRVEGAFALELQHRGPEILERLNTYFGYSAVEKIVIRQGPLLRQKAETKAEVRPLSPQEQESLDETVKPVRHDALKQALGRVGKRLLSTRTDQK